MSPALKTPQRTSVRTRRSSKSNGAAGAGTMAALRAARIPGVRTFGEIYRHAAGCVDSGLGDLSTNKQHLADFGRD